MNQLYSDQVLRWLDISKASEVLKWPDKLLGLLKQAKGRFKMARVVKQPGTFYIKYLIRHGL